MPTLESLPDAQRSIDLLTLELRTIDENMSALNKTLGRLRQDRRYATSYRHMLQLDVDIARGRWEQAVLLLDRYQVMEEIDSKHKTTERPR